MKKNLLKIILVGVIVLWGGTQTEVFCQQKTIVVNSSGGYLNEALKKAFLDEFERQTGIKVILTSPASFAKMKAMVDSKNVEWDLAELPPRDKVRAVKLGYLEKLDYSNINKAELYPHAVDDYAIGYSFYSTILAYNTKKIPEGKNPKTWAEFWDVKKFPGVRSIRSSPDDNLEIASIADGVPLDKLYPLDIERAFKKLDQIKPHIKVWWKLGQQPAQLLTDGEVDLATGWNGRFSDVIKKGAPVAEEWNQGILKLSWWGIPKGTKHYKEAMKLIEFMVQTKYQLEWIKASDYTGPNKKAVELIDPKTVNLKFLATSPENVKKQVLQNADWWLDNADKVEHMWQGWIIK